MPQLGHFEDTILDASGNAISSASVTIYREGATVVSGSGTSPVTITVRHKGKIAAADTVFIGTATGTTYSVDSVTATTLVLSAFSGTLAPAAGSRIVASNNNPTLYGDDQAAATTANPLTTSSSGFADCYMYAGAYEELVSGAGLTTTLKQARVVPTEALGQIRYADQFPGANVGAQIINAIADLPSTGFGGIVDARGVWTNLTIASDIFAGVTVPCTVLLGPVNYTQNTAIRVGGSGNGQRLIGCGRNQTALTAGGSFPASTAMISLGKSGGTYGSRVTDLAVDCNSMAGSIGFLVDGAQEGSGLDRTQVLNAMDAGYRFTSGYGTQQCYCNEMGASTASTAAVGARCIDIGSTSGWLLLENISVGSNVAAPVTNSIYVATGSALVLRNVHIEQATNGINLVSVGGECLVDNFVGHSSVTTCVRIAAAGVTCISINSNGSTNAIVDTQSSPNLTPTGSVSFYSGPDASGVAARRQVFSSNYYVPWNITAQIGGPLQTFTDLAATPSISPFGNYFTVSNTGATNVTNFTGGVQGQLICLFFTTSNTTIVHDVTKIKNRTGANITPGTNTTRSYRLDASSIWWEVS